MLQTTSLDLKFSHSQLRMWNDCRFKWYIKYVLGYDQRDKSEALRKGTVTHEFAANHYRFLAENPRAILSEEALLGNHREFLQARSQDIADVDDLKAVSQVGKLFERYIIEQSMRVDRKFEILKVEEHYELPVVLPSGNEVTFQLYLDTLKRDRETGNLWLEDHKTHSSRPWNSAKIMMDPQLPSYAVILREHGIDIFGMIYNLINVYDYKKLSEQPTDKLFKTEPIWRTPVELDNAFEEMKKAMDDVILNWENPRRSQDADKCSRCWFQDPCLMLLKGFDVEEAFDESVYKQGEVNGYYEEAAED